MKKKVLLGLSGGVDSAIAAYLLLQDGYEVTGCYMRNWDAQLNNDYLGNPTINNSQCPQEKDYQDAKKVAAKLGIPLLRIDYIQEYWDNVFQYFLDEYKNGRTPNPDVLCNREIKFGPFLKYAKEHGFDYIAMGHYARKIYKNNKYYLQKPQRPNLLSMRLNGRANRFFSLPYGRNHQSRGALFGGKTGIRRSKREARLYGRLLHRRKALQAIPNELLPG